MTDPPQGTQNKGLAVLRTYHGQFAEALAELSDVQIDILQQVAEAEKVVSHLVMRAKHTGPFMGVAPTGRGISLLTIRIDRLEDGRIAEHWSVADMAGLMQQLQ